MRWSHEKKDEFIAELRKKPYLYDKSDKNYKNRFLRFQARLELMFQFKSTYRGIESRIRRLQKSYFKQRTLQKSSSPILDQAKNNMSLPRSELSDKYQTSSGETGEKNASMSAEDEINWIKRFLEDDSFLNVSPAWNIPCSKTLCSICSAEDNQGMNLPRDIGTTNYHTAPAEPDSPVWETLFNLQGEIVSSTKKRTSMPHDTTIHSEQVSSESKNYRYRENNAIQTSENISPFISILTDSFMMANIGKYVSAKLKTYDKNDSLKIIQEMKEMFFRYDFLKEIKL